MHIAHCRGQHIDSRKLNELSRFIGRSEARGYFGGFFVDFRTTSDVTDLSLHNDGWIDPLEYVDRLLGLARVLIEG